MIPVIYEDGVFKPQCPVELPEHTRLAIDPQTAEPAQKEKPPLDGVDSIFDILDRRYKSGFTDTAERHNEHNP